jgi:hypothetical protein
MSSCGQKMQHRATITEKPPTMTKQMGIQKNYNSIQQSTSTPSIHSLAERNQGGKTFWMADGGAEQNRMAFS